MSCQSVCTWQRSSPAHTSLREGEPGRVHRRADVDQRTARIAAKTCHKPNPRQLARQTSAPPTCSRLSNTTTVSTYALCVKVHVYLTCTFTDAASHLTIVHVNGVERWWAATTHRDNNSHKHSTLPLDSPFLSLHGRRATHLPVWRHEKVCEYCRCDVHVHVSIVENV